MMVKSYKVYSSVLKQYQCIFDLILVKYDLVPFSQSQYTVELPCNVFGNIDFYKFFFPSNF